MSWLSDWEYRRKITIDSTKIDSNLTHFPVLLKLGASVGLSGADVTAIFDEVGASYKKIAITESDGETELYAEVESWDAVSKTATIWVSRSGFVVSATDDTVLYLYYDGDKADNTTHIGDTPGSSPASSVWDSNYSAVWHFKENPAGTAPQIKDSTANANHGTAYGAMTIDDQVVGKVNGALDFDGINDYISVPYSTSLDAFDELTIEAQVYPHQFHDTNYRYMLNKNWDLGGAGKFILFKTKSADWFIFAIRDSVGQKQITRPFSEINKWYHLACTFKRNDYLNMCLDLSYATPVATIDEALISSSAIRLSDSTNDFNGIMDEFRISKVVRSRDWIKAAYHAQNDSLVTWGELSLSWRYSVARTLVIPAEDRTYVIKE